MEVSYYTKEQQEKYHIDSQGNPLQNLLVGGTPGVGPRWTWDATFPKPAGVRQEGSEEVSYYTTE